MSSDLYQNQPGLEVAPEPEAPQVIQGPTIIEKPYDSISQYPQPQIHQFPQNGAYPNAAYQPSGYPPPSHPIPPTPQQYWRASQDGTYVSAADQMPPSSVPPTSGMILGLRKKKFWLIFGPLIALLVIGLAVGLGVGLGNSHNSSSASDASSATNPMTTSPSSPTSTGTNAAPTPIVCPQGNGTIYEGGGNDPFLVLCNVDYNSNAGTTDIGNQETSTVEGCIDACSDNPSCTGAGWGNFNGHDICWMKGTLGRPQSAPNWFFVIRQ
ncbi:hypothetical protein AAE478_000031 [Parahypoxylon ruwenzoriense]